MKYTPLQLTSVVIGAAGLIALYFGYFPDSPYATLLIPLWIFLLSTVESTMRRSEIRQLALIRLLEAYSRYNSINLMLRLASSEEAYNQAYREFMDWFNSTLETVQETFSVDDAETFRVIGNETASTMVLQLNQLRPYTQANREMLLQSLEVYGVRLRELMKQVPTIQRSWWLTPLIAPKSPSALPSAS